jgi:hypothetical protein
MHFFFTMLWKSTFNLKNTSNIYVKKEKKKKEKKRKEKMRKIKKHQIKK